MTADPVQLTQQLIQCPSITPLDAGTLDIVSRFLDSRGFIIERLDSQEVGNLYARKGTYGPHLCFVGHTDVVPPGDISHWSVDPFKGEIREGKLYGRGVVDMKGAIGAFLAAIDTYLKQYPLSGSLSVLLTTDEEGPATDGIQYVVEKFKGRQERIDACLVGEPTNTASIGDTVKVGRRGSLNGTISVQGKSGHVAYPQLAKNPISPLLTYLKSLIDTPLDAGMEHFIPTHLEVTSIDVNNPTRNVIPFEAIAKFNIRFTPKHTIESLTQYFTQKAKEIGLDQDGLSFKLDVQGSGGAFFCEDRNLQDLVSGSIQGVTGHTPEFSTSGGTSDARFMKDICPVIEFGLINATAHQIDEHIAVEDINTLSEIYKEILNRFFTQD